MKKKFIVIIILFGQFLFSQTQIGNSILGMAINDFAGKSVSLSANGSVLAISSNGTPDLGQYKGVVRVFQYVTNNWIQVGNDIIGEAYGDSFGYSIALSADGNILAVGAYANDGGGSESGHVRIYQNTNNNWTQIGADINGPWTYIYSGISVSLSSDGSIVAIGASNDSSNGFLGGGKVRVYENNNGSWIQKGSDMSGEADDDSFGVSVSLSSDGTTVAIGAPGNNSNGNNSGKTYVFGYSIGNWAQIGNGVSGEGAGDVSGQSVSISANGSIIAIGAPQNNSANGIDAGQVRVYKNSANTWTLLGNEINGESAGFRLGYDVSLSGNGEILTAGTPYGANNAGRVKIFKNIANVWTQIGNNIDGETIGDYSSDALAISPDGTTVAIGSPSSGNYFGKTRVFDLSSILNTSQHTIEEFSISPNPTQDYFSISSNTTIESITIYSIMGQKIKDLNSSNASYCVAELASGNYIIQVATPNGIRNTKLIKK